MLVQALVSFSGSFSMYKGEIKECSDNAILQDLLQAKYIEEVTEPPKPLKGKKVKTNES